MSIKRTVHINERPYELTVDNEQEEIALNEAVNMLRNKIKEFSKVVTGRDKNDLLAMAALEITANYVMKNKENSFVENDLTDRLKTIDQWLEQNM
ncbi:MAG: cell division protein ZapA [Bacteroidales bacterium]|nr:cell division protein ZapA [Bacteroidales bacterium]MCF8333880.1 cell division protein ZapA [Bacteroidales bacterium]